MEMLRIARIARIWNKKFPHSNHSPGLGLWSSETVIACCNLPCLLKYSVLRLISDGSFLKGDSEN